MDKRLVVERKVRIVRESLADLRGMANLDQATFLADHRNIAAAEHLLQTAIQALIDLSAIVAGEKLPSMPAKSTDLVEALHQAGVFPADRRDVYIRMVKFRNLLVHLYNGIDVNQVFHVVKNELHDIELFLTDLLAALPA